MWCVLELNLSIVGGSMPAMKPVLQKYFPRLLASTQGASDSGNYYMDDTRSKPKRSRITDPYNISRDRDSNPLPQPVHEDLHSLHWGLH